MTLFGTSFEAAESEHVENVLAFFVAGRPQTAGSKTAIRKGDRTLVVESGDRDAKRAWRADVRAAAAEAMVEPELWPTSGPLRVSFEFFRRRPRGHYGTGRNDGVLKAGAALLRPVARPDVLKLARSVEDALTEIVWTDDSVIVDERLSKTWGTVEGVRVTVERL